MNRQTGRIGEPTEYVELDFGHSHKSIVVQRLGAWWMIYLCGEDKAVRILRTKNKGRALFAAEVAALALEKDAQSRGS